MKNRRNTRRGRAKRWARNRRGLRLRGTKIEVRPGDLWLPSHSGFGVFNKDRLFRGMAPWRFALPSRAAAMRCAEAWDRLFRDQRRRQRKNGFALAA